MITVAFATGNLNDTSMVGYACLLVRRRVLNRKMLLLHSD